MAVVNIASICDELRLSSERCARAVKDPLPHCGARQRQVFHLTQSLGNGFEPHALDARSRDFIPAVSSSSVADDFRQREEEDSEDAGNTAQSYIMSKDAVARMRAEMRNADHRRREELSRRRHEVQMGCPIFLSLRMRRILEFALRLSPESLDCDASERGFDAVHLQDHLAKLVNMLLFRHGVSLSQVHASLRAYCEKEGDRCGPTTDPWDLYTGVLDTLRVDLREDTPSGIDLKAPINGTVPACKAVGDGPLLEKLLRPAIGGSPSVISDAQSTSHPLRRLRSFIGPEDDATDDCEYKVKRKIVMNELPIYHRKQLIQDTVAANQVTLLQGETGSGKTTQVPAFILELAEAARMEARSGGTILPPVRIIVTQPRRIAAITVAKRVAEELGEVVGEGVVGYKIRGVSVCSPKCKILFCTTGVLLRRIAQEGQQDMFSPKTVTHLIVDEVHERSCETDFMLTFLKQASENRPQLKVVLMSATMDAECFLEYFSNPQSSERPPLLKVEGQCFSTAEVFLDSLTTMLGYEMPKGMSPDDLKLLPPRSGSENDAINYELIMDTLIEMDRSDVGAWQFVQGRDENVNTEVGTVLIFFPGAGEISQMISTMEERGIPEHWWVLPLHGALGAEEQQDAFKTVFPAGKTIKIIACTNVAETSVTVPNVTAVIDSCRERRTGVDKFSNTPQLKEQYCAKDSLKQRRGRAGRVRPGVCIRLISRSKMDSLEEKTLPEMRRVPLENIYLQLCAIGIGSHEAFFDQTPDPPEKDLVALARAALLELGALDLSAPDGLTPLGRHLAALPCHPRLGKILLLGCLLSVPGPVLSICASMSGRSPLMTTQDAQKRSAWQNERGKLLQQMGCKSDHCAWAVLMRLWMSEGVVRYDFCRKYGLSYERMSAAWFERRHLCESLVQAGFLSKEFLTVEREGCKLDAPTDMPNWTVVCSAIAGGLFPNIVHVDRSTPKYQGPSNPGERNKWMRYQILQTQIRGETTDSFQKACNMHPNSLLFGMDHFQCPLVAFCTIQQTTKLYVYDATEVPPWSLLLFGPCPIWDATWRRLEVGNLAKFPCANGDKLLPLICAAREALQSILARKIRQSSFDAAGSPEVLACVELLRTGGMGYELLPQEAPDWPFLRELIEEGKEKAAVQASERVAEERLLNK